MDKLVARDKTAADVRTVAQQTDLDRGPVTAIFWLQDDLGVEIEAKRLREDPVSSPRMILQTWVGVI